MKVSTKMRVFSDLLFERSQGRGGGGKGATGGGGLMWREGGGGKQLWGGRDGVGNFVWEPLTTLTTLNFRPV